MKVKISQMLQQIHGMERHRQTEVTAQKRQTSIADYERVLREKDRELDRLRHQLLNTEARLQELMGTDLLTGLPNRHAFKDELVHSVKRAVRLGYSLAILFIDIDGMREINLQYGHEVGDTVLIEVAKVLRNSVREIDMPARWGGEELVSMLHETDSEGAVNVAERLQRRISMLEIKDPKTNRLISVTASIAVCCYPKHHCEAQGLLEIARESMLIAKERGGNCVVAAH